MEGSPGVRCNPVAHPWTNDDQWVSAARSGTSMGHKYAQGRSRRTPPAPSRPSCFGARQALSCMECGVCCYGTCLEEQQERCRLLQQLRWVQRQAHAACISTMQIHMLASPPWGAGCVVGVSSDPGVSRQLVCCASPQKVNRGGYIPLSGMLARSKARRDRLPVAPGAHPTADLVLILILILILMLGAADGGCCTASQR
jgi:hypothetical protein